MEKKANRLQHETSPYLLQHAENPVDWYPWGEEAFRRAAREDKPVFLSIGYSTCHWCHVMAHESFEDEEIARLLNEGFICIKVDKEERPDIDGIYMSVCQAFTGSGGWPTSIFMTAEQRPFFAGTYFPKHSGFGAIGMKELLAILGEKWKNHREELLERADVVMLHLAGSSSPSPRADEQPAARAVNIYRRAFDRENGGFGGAPKFPAAHNLLFLLGYYRRYKDNACLNMAEHTLMQMYRGGLFDHIGGGFSRYSTDEYFLAPHFEKMLYDNALLISAYCHAHHLTQNRERAKLYLHIAQRTADYILREMTDPDGGFYSAQDADSEGEEGKYYLFAPEEVSTAIGREAAESFCAHFDITPEGNFEGKSIPNLLGSDPLDASFEVFFPRLYEYRKNRHALHTDKKILTAWNSLMISSLCELYLANKNAACLEAAKRADGFIRKNLMENGDLYVSFAGGRRGARGFLDDYAWYCFARLSLYRATLRQEYLDSAQRLCKKAISDFGDDARGGFYFSGSDNERLILRPKESYDGAMPSGNSVMAWNLIKLWKLTDREEYRTYAQKQLDFLSSEAASYPIGHSMFLLSLLEFTDPSLKVRAVSDAGTDSRELVHMFPADGDIALCSPTAEYPLKDGKTTFYICAGGSCHPPVNDPEGILKRHRQRFEPNSL